MASYAIAMLSSVHGGPAMIEYLQGLDATLAPYDGHFIIHGGETEVLEGEAPGTVVVIEFPDRTHAREWYSSAPYQAILPLRLDNAEGNLFLVDGVARDHKAADVIALRYRT